MTIIQIYAILIFLLSFGASEEQAEKIKDILIKSNSMIATSTQNVPRVFVGESSPTPPTLPTQNDAVSYKAVEATTTPETSEIPKVLEPVKKNEIIVNRIVQREASIQGNQPFGSVLFYVDVKTNGEIEKMAEVVMEAPDNVYGTTTRAVNTNTGVLFYVPLTPGEKNVVFTSGDATKEYKVTF